MIKKNIFANLVGKFWSLLSSFLFIPLYIRFLGFESYSVISFTLMISGIMAILDGGLTATLSREFARKDILQADKIKVYKNLETIYFILTLICILTVFTSSTFIADHWLTVKNFTSVHISLFLKIISFEIGFQLLFRFYIGGYLGLDRQVEANFFQIFWGVFRNGLVLIILVWFPTLENFFLWQTITTVIFTLFIKIFFDKIIIGKISFDINLKIEWKVLIKIWKFAGGMMLISLVAAVNTQLDKLSISKLLSVENLGYYTLVISICQVLIIIVNPISTSLLPRFTSYYSTKQNQIAKGLYTKTSVLVSILVFSFMMVIAFYAKEIVWVWTGSRQLGLHTYKLIPIVSLGYAMYALQPLAYVVAIANGDTKINNLLGVFSMIITLPGYYFATKVYGLMGAGTVFCFVQCVSAILYLFFVNKKYIRSNIIKDIYWKQIFMPFLAAGIITFLFSRIPILMDNNRIFSLIWLGIATFVTLILSSIILIPFKELKSLIVGKNIKT